MALLSSDFTISFDKTAFEKNPGEELQKAFYSIEELYVLLKQNIPQYSSSGDINIGVGEGLFTILAKGAANTKLFINAGATAPEWAVGMKVVSTTRDVSVTGDQAITGAGFKPSAAIVLANIGGNAATSIGITDAALNGMIENYHNNTADQWNSASYLVIMQTGVGVNANAIWKSFDADGMTITWTKNGSPTGTANLFILFLR